MSDKLHAASDRSFALPDIAVVTMKGRDATAFAHAQFMSDVAALEAGDWHWSGWLTPKGRVIALFAILRVDAETLHLLVMDADPAAFAASLQRFVFRSKVTITVDAGVQVAGTLEAPTRAQGARADIGDAAIELDWSIDGHPRALRLSSGAPSDAAHADRWRDLDMAAGLPRLPTGQAEAWTPQQLSLDRLRAFSVRKGCYPGQEIVARTHFLGQARRGLIALTGAADAEPGADVAQDGQTIGRLVSVSPQIQLAVLPLERADTPLSIADAAVSIVPLLDGLAR